MISLLHETAWPGIYACGETNVYMQQYASIHICRQRKLISEIKCVLKVFFLKIINKLSFHFKFIKCNRSRREKVNYLQEDGKVCF